MQFVTHEMKTPLTAIQGSSELMGRYALPEEKRKQMAGMINSESKRLAQMIETFLNAERLSAGQMELKREFFAADEIILRCIERIRPIADRKRIRITKNPLPSETLTGDRELVEYAFYNLLSNAVKYSPEATVVTVSGTRNNGRVQVSVQDQGVGMDAKDTRRIFEKFYRTKSAEQSNEKGTGIGLSIVDQIVQQHHGTVTVRSELGKGSTFTVSLPTLPHYDLPH
jgi:signal transduction histidine kinase